MASDELERTQPAIDREGTQEHTDPESSGFPSEEQPVPEQGPEQPARETTGASTRPRLPARYRRRALGALDRARLQDLCDRYELDVQDRRANDSYIAALIRARRLDFAEVLGQLKREELQAICDALDLFRGGRAKEVLVERILAGPNQPGDSAHDGSDGPAAPAYHLTPKRKRTALGVLSRDRLAELTSHFDLEVHDLRAKADHIAAVTRKRSLPFAEVLQLVSRDELKTMCVELGLDDGGREKRVIIERIVGEPLPDSGTGDVLVERHAAAARVPGPDVPPDPVPVASTPPTPPISPTPEPVDGEVARREFPLVARAREAGVLDGKGALIVAPTATGKSTIGRRVVQHALERNRDGLCAYLVPFRALAWELYEAMYDELVAADPSLRVRIATGDATDPVDPSSAEVIVGTYESFAALHSTNAVDPAVLVVDEIHMLADESRGPPLEMLLAHFRGTEVQLCGLSAVIDDPDPLARWLGVDVVRGTTEDRAVPVEFAVERVNDLDAELEARTLEAIQRGDNVLVFCHSKAQAEKVARNVADGAAGSLGRSDQERLGELKFFLDDPESEHGNERLAELVPKGVAYHHAGLVRDVRRQIEDAYRDGALKLIASTPTLAAGVNLPAQVVFLKGVHRIEMQRNYHRRVLLPVSEVLNMLGRAGRPGQSTSGSGVVLIQQDVPKDERTALEKALRRGAGDPVHSRMGEKFDWILRLALRETAEHECTLGQLREALMRTLWYAEEGGAVEFHRKLRDDLMEDIPSFSRASGLELLLDSVTVQPDGVTGSVQSGDHTYDISIRLESFDCSCPSRQRWHHGDVCKHLARAIHDLLFGGGVPDEARYRAMYACLDLFRETLDLGTKLREALGVLEHWQLVDATATGYRATPAGQVAAWSGLDLLLAVDAFRRIKEIQGTPEPREIALWTVDDFFGTPRDREKWHKTLEPWLDEVRTADVPLPTKHRGEFERIRGDLVRVVGLYAQVARALRKDSLARSAETAAGCLRHGVRPDALPLAALNIPELRRGRCRYLIEQHGIKTVDDLADAVAGYIADRRHFLSPGLCEEWIQRAQAIRARRNQAHSAPAPEQRSALDDLLAQFRVEPLALETP